MRIAVVLLTILSLSFFIAGCQPNTEPIERTANKAFDTIIGPAVEKAAKELSTRTGALQGQGSLINPGYVVSGYGIFGTGVVYEVKLKADGVSANVAGHAQADQGQATTDERPPGNRSEPAVSPQ